MDNPVLINLMGILLEGISYGAFCVIFAAYLKIRRKREGYGSKLVLLHLLTLNFVLCTIYLVLSVIVAQTTVLLPRIALTHDALYAFIDLISQIILIYRCWIMWRNPWIMVFPILLSVAFLVTSLATLIGTALFPNFYVVEEIVGRFPDWYFSAVVAFFSLSLAVNALVTGLIVLKIVLVYRQLQELNAGSSYKSGTDLVPIISILVESGVMTFVAQLVQTILYKVAPWAFPTVAGLVVMFYGLSTTIVLVRVEMGLAYNGNNTSPESSARATTLHFASSESKSESATMGP